LSFTDFFSAEDDRYAVAGYDAPATGNEWGVTREASHAHVRSVNEKFPHLHGYA
jgi:hypothetical protein